MIYDNLKNIKSWLSENKTDLFFSASFFLIAVVGFGLGRLSVTFEKPKEPIRIEEVNLPMAPANINSAVQETGGGNFVGSKNGSTYYLPQCLGAARITEENKIWFSSREEAESLGYKPAKNCSGI